MPWTPENPPRIAKNWTPAQRRKCVSAANAVLRTGGTDEEAIFACIHAAGIGQKQGGDEYDRAAEKASRFFQHIINLYFAGKIGLQELEKRFKDGIKDNYLHMALLGTRPIEKSDLRWIESRLEKEFAYADRFLDDLRNGTTSQPRAVWRAGLYGYPRAAYVNFKVPPEVSQLMPVLPGDDCLGGSLCKCSLEAHFDEDDGSLYVYWSLDPTSESCPVCIAHAAQSPYVFSEEDVTNARDN